MSGFIRTIPKEITVNNTLMLATIVASLASGVVVAQQKDIPVQVTYRNATGPLPDGVRSDGLASFTGAAADYVHGSDDNVLALIQSAGQYRFSTRLATNKPLRRRLCFDFGTQPSPLGQTYCADVLIGMLGDGNLQDMRVGEQLSKRMRHSWTHQGFEYVLGFGTDWDQDGVQDSPSVTATCLSETDAVCSEWSLQTAGGATLSRAQVLKRELGPMQLVGTYSMPFEVQFSRK